MNGVRRSGAGWGSSVVIYGAGLLGQLAVDFAGSPVLALLLPSTSPTNGSHCCQKTLASWASTRRVRCPRSCQQGDSGTNGDIVFEVTGNAALIPQEFELLRSQEGRFPLEQPEIVDDL